MVAPPRSGIFSGWLQWVLGCVGLDGVIPVCVKLLDLSFCVIYSQPRSRIGIIRF